MDYAISMFEVEGDCPVCSTRRSEEVTAGAESWKTCSAARSGSEGADGSR
jgi:hypothetical protein